MKAQLCIANKIKEKKIMTMNYYIYIYICYIKISKVVK